MPPNVLLVVLDTARRDAFEPYGAPAGCTPAIRDLAARGHALERAYATASWTLPSHASMFTGMLPRQLGLMQAPGGTRRAAHPLANAKHRLLPEVLRQSGYTACAWSANLWVSPMAGFDVGFDEFHDLSLRADARMKALLGNGPQGWLAWLAGGLRARDDDGASAVGRGLRESIAGWAGTPTFWFVNLVECHSPYLPPRPWADLLPADRIAALIDAKRYLGFESICLHVAGRRRIPPSALDRMHHLHRRAAAYLDDWLAGVLEALDSRGLLDETLVIVTSDHGENFGQDGLVAHGFSVDERLIHVPLVMAGPGASATDEVFGLDQLPCLIAEAAGLEQNPWEQREVPEGIAVAQYDPMGSAHDPAMIAYARKWGLERDGLERITARYTGVTDGIHKLVMRDGEELIYDLDADPDESSPLDPGSDGGAFSALRATLDLPGVTTADLVAPVTEAVTAPAGTEVAAIEAKMKLLGYL